MTDSSGSIASSRDDEDVTSLWKREMELRMLEWGMVDPSSKDRLPGNEDDEATVSKKFWDDMVDFCQRAAGGEIDTRNASTVNLPEMLPVDPESAVRLVLDQEIRALQTDDGFVVVTDALSEYEVPSYLPPYWYDAETGRSGLKGAYKYKRIPSDMLNPLVRFHFERVSAKDQLESQFVTNGTPESVAIRAIVAHGACFAKGGVGAACVNCHANKVRWNGYFENGSIQYRYWKKLVCEECGSVYEIKSARNIEHAMYKFQKWVDGGNFLEEYAVVQQELREASRSSAEDVHDEGGFSPVGARQFVAILVTDETVQWDGTECWPVYAAAVERVVPLLKDRSFERGDDDDDDDDQRRPKVYTRIFFEMPSPYADPDTPWFHVPVFQYDAKEMASEIIDSL